MTRFAWTLGFFLIALARAVAADDAVTLKYQYTAGQVLRYEGKHSMTVESTVGGKTQKLESRTNSVREWRVLNVDEKGNARLALTIIQAQVEAATPDGQRIAFDTEKDEKTPMAGIIGKPLVEVVLSPSGQVVELGPPKHAAAGQFVANLRTQIVPFPPYPIAVGTAWQQELTLPLPPPVDRDEKIRVRQTFKLEKVKDSIATINLQSTLAEEIKDRTIVERIAQFLPSGRIELDLSRGLVRTIDMVLEQKVTDFAGADSVMTVTGSDREELKESVAGVEPKRK
jgi:hypothetical protein